jgi:tape measure domain-containing protein
VALSIGELVGYLKLDKGNWDRGMQSVEADSKRSGTIFGTMAKGAGLLATGLGIAAVAGGTMGLKTAAGLESAQIAFETMLGSGEKARAFLDDLKDFAAKTPFEFPELQTAASSLISAGFEAGQVIPIMTTLGDVTSGMGTGAEGVQRATVALQQMSAAGRITGEDLNQLRDAGVPVFDLLAAATGKSKEEIAELAAAGKLGKDEMNALFEALESGKGLERFNGLMEKQSQSLAGVWSTVKDTVNMGLASVITPLVPIITTLLPKGAAVLTRVFEALASGATKIVDYFGKANAASSGLSSVWVKVGPRIMGILRQLWDIASTVFGGIAGFLEQHQGLFKIWGDRLGTAFGVVGDIVSTVLAGIQTFLSENGATFATWGAQVFGIISKLGDLVATVFGFIQGFLTEHWETIEAVATQAWETISTVVGSVLSIITGIISTAIALIQGDWSAAWEAIKGVFSNAWEGIKSILTLALQLITDVILPGAWWLIQQGASLLWEGIKAIFNEGVAWLEGVPGWIVEKLTGMWDFVTEQVGSMKDDVLAKIQELIDWLPSLPGKLMSAAGDVFGWIVSAARTAAAQAWAAIKSSFTGGEQASNDWWTQPGNVPGLAEGGIVTRPTLAVVGEGKGPEAVIPLDRLDAILERAYQAGRGGTDGPGMVFAPVFNNPVERYGSDMMGEAHEMFLALGRS